MLDIVVQDEVRWDEEAQAGLIEAATVGSTRTRTHSRTSDSRATTYTTHTGARKQARTRAQAYGSARENASALVTPLNPPSP